MSEFGPLVSASQVEAAILSVIQTWMHTYMGQTERDTGRAVNSMLRPRSYGKTAGNPLSIPDRSLPRVVVQSPGLIAPPEPDGETIALTWGATVWMFSKGRDEDDTQDICRDNAATLRRLLLQKVPDFVDLVELLDENYDALPAERENTLAGCELVFSLRVPDATDIGPGPTDPAPAQPPTSPTDYGNWPEVGSTDETVIHVPPDEEVGP
jgi:hypothetical protein